MTQPLFSTQTGLQACLLAFPSEKNRSQATVVQQHGFKHNTERGSGQRQNTGHEIISGLIGLVRWTLPDHSMGNISCQIRTSGSLTRGGGLLAFVRDSTPLDVGQRPLGVGGGALEGGFREGRWGGGGWHKALVVSSGGGGVPLTSPCPPSNHTITINLTLTFAVTWFGHVSHVDWAEHHPPNFIQGCFCHIIALHFGPQYSL